MQFILASVLCVLSLLVKTYWAADKSTGSDHCKPPPPVDQREASSQVDAGVLEGANKRCKKQQEASADWAGKHTGMQELVSNGGTFMRVKI